MPSHKVHSLCFVLGVCNIWSSTTNIFTNILIILLFLYFHILYVVFGVNTTVHSCKEYLTVQ